MEHAERELHNLGVLTGDGVDRRVMRFKSKRLTLATEVERAGDENVLASRGVVLLEVTDWEGEDNEEEVGAAPSDTV